MLAEQGVAPGPPVSQTGARVGLGRTVRALCKRWALPSMAGRDGNEGGVSRPGHRGLQGLWPNSRKHGSPGRETPQVERRKACLPIARQAGAFKRCPVLSAPFGAPLPLLREQEEGAAPAP